MFQNITHVLKQIDAEFNSWKYLARLRPPTLILHAENDYLVPERLGNYKGPGVRVGDF